VAGPDTLQPLASAILDLEEWLSGVRVPHLFIGGVAVAFLARPRTTNDVDGIVLVPDDGFADFLRSATKHGFPSRHSDAATFARSNRIFLLRHASSGVDVDLSAGSLGFEQEIVQKARRVVAFGRSLPIPRAADLVILKAIAARPQDYADITAVLEQNPRLDKKRVLRLVSLFAELLEAPELVTGIESLFRGKGIRSRFPAPASGYSRK